MDEDIPLKEAAKVARPMRDLEEMSIAALGEYIDELQAEIVRVQELIAGKQSQRLVAEEIFKDG